MRRAALSARAAALAAAAFALLLTGLAASPAAPAGPAAPTANAPAQAPANAPAATVTVERTLRFHCPLGVLPFTTPVDVRVSSRLPETVTAGARFPVAVRMDVTVPRYSTLLWRLLGVRGWTSGSADSGLVATMGNSVLGVGLTHLVPDGTLPEEGPATLTLHEAQAQVTARAPVSFALDRTLELRVGLDGGPPGPFRCWAARGQDLTVAAPAFAEAVP